MRGSTMDAMADAVDNACVFLFGVSLSYKESANCRMEANYASTTGVEMIALMMVANFKANGWLGMVLGTKLWHAFYDCEKDDEQTFSKRMDSLVNEIGDRALFSERRAEIGEGVPPTAVTVAAPATPMARTATQMQPVAASGSTTSAHVERSFMPSMASHSPSPLAVSSPSIHGRAETGGGGGVSEMAAAFAFFQEMQAASSDSKLVVDMLTRQELISADQVRFPVSAACTYIPIHRRLVPLFSLLFADFWVAACEAAVQAGSGT